MHVGGAQVVLDVGKLDSQQSVEDADAEQHMNEEVQRLASNNPPTPKSASSSSTKSYLEPPSEKLDAKARECLNAVDVEQQCSNESQTAKPTLPEASDPNNAEKILEQKEDNENLRKEYEQKQRKLQEQLDDVVTGKDRELAAAKQKMDLEHRSQILKLKQEHTAALDKALKDVHASHAAELEKLRQTNEKTVKKLKEEQAAAKSEMQSLHEKELTDLKADYESQLSKLNREWREKLSNHNAKNDARDNSASNALLETLQGNVMDLGLKLTELSNTVADLRDQVVHLANKNQQKTEQMNVLTMGDPPPLATSTPKKKQRDAIPAGSLDNLQSLSSDDVGSSAKREKNENVVERAKAFLAKQGEQKAAWSDQLPDSGFERSSWAELPHRGGDLPALLEARLFDLQRDLHNLTEHVHAGSTIQNGTVLDSAIWRNTSTAYPDTDKLIDQRYAAFLHNNGRYPVNFGLGSFALQYKEEIKPSFEEQLASLKQWVEEFENKVVS